MESVFDNLDLIRLSPDTLMAGKASEIVATVPVRKPSRQEFFRTNSNPNMSLVTAVFEDRESRQTYFVTPAMLRYLVDEVKPALLVPAMTRQGTCFLWAVALPKGEGGSQDWGKSALKAVELGKTSWIRVAADMNAGHYRVYQAQGEIDDPIWPAKTLSELLKIAFEDRTIDSTDHPIYKRLAGK
jgi:hypothetical protein